MFNFHIFVTFQIRSQLLISIVVGEHTLYDFSPFKFRLILWPSMWFILESVPYPFEKHVYSAVAG